MFFAATPQAQPQADGFLGFFSQYGLLLMLFVLIIFMFWSSRRRMARMRTEQAEKATKMVPGAKVLLQGGLYGTIVSYNGDDLAAPARVEIAPGVVIEVHSQGILRIVEDETPVADSTPPAIIEEPGLNVKNDLDNTDLAADAPTQTPRIADAGDTLEPPASADRPNDADDTKPQA